MIYSLAFYFNFGENIKNLMLICHAVKNIYLLLYKIRKSYNECKKLKKIYRKNI